MRIPWWAKIGAKMALSRLPFGYGIWRKLGLFRHGSMDDSGYALHVFDAHMKRCAISDRLHGATIVELGPGDSLGTAIIAAAHGARAVLVDTGAYARADVTPYRELGSALRAQGLEPPTLDDCVTLEDVLERCGARYLTTGLAALKGLDDASVDVIFSHAVLEHVRLSEFLDTMRECRRILKPDGASSHQVDLRDHLAEALHNLRFSEDVWESDLFVRSGFYTNRIRYTEMMTLFASANFRIESTDVRRWNELPISRARLAPQFRGLDDEELRVNGFDVVLR